MALKRSAAFDRKFMQIALSAAARQLGRTTPNPAVGCVIVRSGKVVAHAATGSGGRPHAETRALAAAGKRARGSTAYVTFEPCAHFGHTAPCAAALVRAGLRRVVVGCLDPYPPVRGRGVRMLRRSGIAVTTGVLEAECRRLNEGFITRVIRRRPFVTLKLALTLDGRIATTSGDSRWISSPAAREIVHRWRSHSDAVIVGAGTVIADNPRLTCRTAGGRDPIRIVVDGRLRTPPGARVFSGRSASRAILVTSRRNLAAATRRYGSERTEIMAVREAGREPSLAALMRELGRRGCCRVMLEGGAHIAGAALRAGVVDRIAFFIAPKIVGGGLGAIEGLKISSIQAALRLGDLSATPIGGDLLIQTDVIH